MADTEKAQAITVPATTGANDSVATLQPSPLADKSYVGSRYANYVLIVLTIVYVFNFVDRQIISILAEDIKSDLKVTDAQFLSAAWPTSGREDR
jgi:hypothetical protein